MTEALIQARDLYRSFGATQAVRGVSLNVAAGEIYGLVGPDGAGKTTILRMLCGGIAPTSGSITLAGIPLARHPEEARSHVGYLSQRFSLYEDLTVTENLRFFAEVRGLPPETWLQRSQEILAFVGLQPFAERRTAFLSGGMKQKLALAVALVTRPDILLLDEPTTGVDPVTRQEFWQLILRLVADGGMAALVSTPYMDEASRCTRIGFLRHGQLVVEGTVRQLRSRLDGQVLELGGSPLPAMLQAAQPDPDVEGVQRFGSSLHLRVRPGMAGVVQQRLLKSLPGVACTPIQPQLEDVFLALAGEE